MLFSLVTRRRIWLNVERGVFSLSCGPGFYEACLLPYKFRYRRDFFRNSLWEVMDEPAPIETILEFIRRYGNIPQTLLTRIYFYEAKKKRRSFKSVKQAMDRRISRLKIRARRPNSYENSGTFSPVELPSFPL